MGLKGSVPARFLVPSAFDHSGNNLRAGFQGDTHSFFFWMSKGHKLMKKNEKGTINIYCFCNTFHPRSQSKGDRWPLLTPLFRGNKALARLSNLLRTTCQVSGKTQKKWVKPCSPGCICEVCLQNRKKKEHIDSVVQAVILGAQNRCHEAIDCDVLV